MAAAPSLFSSSIITTTRPNPDSPFMGRSTRARAVTPADPSFTASPAWQSSKAALENPASTELVPFLDTMDNISDLVPTGRKLRVLLLSSDTGGGHRASAAALQAAIEEALPGLVKVNIVDFWVQFARGPFTKFPEQYAFLAKHPFLWKTTYELTRFPPFRYITETFFDTFAHQRVKEAFNEYKPDVIISVHPLINTLSLHVLKNMAKLSGVPRVPYFTVVTDLGGAHPTWFHPDADMTYVPSSAVANIALRCAIPAGRVKQIGLPIRQDFWTRAPDKAAVRAEKGLSDDCPVILIIGGGDGVGKLGKIAKVMDNRLYRDAGPRAAQLVIVCGKNEGLANSLRKYNWNISATILGYVNDMATWMAASDIICTKAGPGTIAEALIRGLPILLHSFLPGQEAANVRYVLDAGVGEYATRPRRIAHIISKWITQPNIMRAMSEKARDIGAPRATQHIVHHLLLEAADKRVRNAKMVESRNRFRNSQEALIAGTQLARYQLRGGQNNYTTGAMARSHLLFHLKGFVRFAVGAIIARDAFYGPSYSRLLATTTDDDEYPAASSTSLNGRGLRRSIELPPPTSSL